MLYEFREEKSNSKYKSNKREKIKNKKAETKNKKIKQKNLVNKQDDKTIKEQTEKWEDINLKWEDINIEDIKNIEEWYIASKEWWNFKILNKKNWNFFEAKLEKTIPSHLRKSFVIGDKVFYQKEKWEFIIKKRWERINYISKTQSNTARFWATKEQLIVSNIDMAIIVAPIKNPNFDHKLIDRYIVICQRRWVTPIICLNKIDLTDKRNPILNDYKKSGIQIIETSTISWEWILELKKVLKDKMSVLLWKSWVGKSSLVNKLSSNKKLSTQTVNQKSGEGKHTTTSSNIYKRDANSYIIDTPGTRALWLDQINKKDLQNYFSEFSKYKSMCKYKKCLHETEPDCAIQNAAKNKEINKERYESYLRILKDLI